MGAGVSRVNQSIIRGSEIKKINKEISKIPKSLNKEILHISIFTPKNIFHVSRSICKIKTSETLGSGFLIKFFKDEEDYFHCLMSCEHVLKKELIERKEKICFYYDNENKNKEIILDKTKRFIKAFDEIKIDATVVEILPIDNIHDDYFLMPEIDFMNHLNELNNKKIHIPQFPEGGDLSYSEGKVVNIKNFELIHKCSTLECSSGSPLILKDSTNVIGIHKSGNTKIKENYADSIGPIYNFFKKDLHEKSDEEKEKGVFNNDSKKIDSKIKTEELINMDLLEKVNLIDYFSYLEENKDFPLKVLHDSILAQSNICFISINKILKIHSDNGLVEFIDQKGVCQILRVDHFFKILIENSKNYQCKWRNQKIYHHKSDCFGEKYCIQCNIYFCSTCEIYHNNIMHKKPKTHIFIPTNKVGSTCMIHNMETSLYCNDCEKSLCKECFGQFHKGHKKSEINRKKIKKAKKEIIRRNMQLSKLKEFLEMIQSAYESDPENPLYRKNVINVVKSIELEKGRNKYDKELAIYRTEQIKNDINYY